MDQSLAASIASLLGAALLRRTQIVGRLCDAPNSELDQTRSRAGAALLYVLPLSNGHHLASGRGRSGPLADSLAHSGCFERLRRHGLLLEKRKMGGAMSSYG